MRFIFLFFTFIIASAFSQEKKDKLKHLYENNIYKNNIRTVLFFKDGWELSYPVIKLNTDDRLHLGFDDIDSTKKKRKYFYTFIHCDASWKASDLLQMEYLEGFHENRIDNFKNSFNTFCTYKHYSLVLPNNDIKFKISGNYVLKVYENYDEEDVLFTLPFVIYEDLLTINTTIKKPSLTELLLKAQEVDFSVIYDQFPIKDPFQNLKVIISQNGKWSDAVYGLQPKFVREKELIYDYDKENVFPGGGEFRHFDTKNVKFWSERTDSVYFQRPFYHFVLEKDEMLGNKTYSYHEDLNGKYLVKLEGSNQSELDADYVYVHFTLPNTRPHPNGKFYVYGGLTNWVLDTKNEMKYIANRNSYELTLFLKQGYYNYQYIFVSDDLKIPEITLTEGSYFETENDYSIFVYYNDKNLRYDRAIGYAILNSIKRY